MADAPPTWLIVGLGNPGSAYAGNRHNVGYWCINRLARRLGIQMRTRRLFAIGEGTSDGHGLALAKPRTYVNNSGHAVSALLKQRRLDMSQALVICDDLDLPLGKIRLRPHGSHGGQKGLKSLIGALGSGAFPRLRIGIGRPALDGQPVTDPDLIAVYVLTNPPEQERQLLDEAVSQAVEAVTVIIHDGLEAAMNRYNR